MPSSIPRYSFEQDATYLIAGGLGGLGRAITRWMVSRGARNFILLSRSGAKGKEATDLIEEVKSRGVKIAAPPCDVSIEDEVSTTLEKYRYTMPPVRGCIQASMVLKVGFHFRCPTGLNILTFLTGRALREFDPARFQRSHQTESTRFLELA